MGRKALCVIAVVLLVIAFFIGVPSVLPADSQHMRVDLLTSSGQIISTSDNPLSIYTYSNIEFDSVRVTVEWYTGDPDVKEVLVEVDAVTMWMETTDVIERSTYTIFNDRYPVADLSAVVETNIDLLGQSVPLDSEFVIAFSGSVSFITSTGVPAVVSLGSFSLSIDKGSFEYTANFGQWELP